MSYFAAFQPLRAENDTGEQRQQGAPRGLKWNDFGFY